MASLYNRLTAYKGINMAELEIFLSWSRHASHEAAKILKEWLPEALPDSKPWMSSEDITKGTPWFASISAQLSRSPVCLICITPENIGSPWLYYEAGAIAHAMQGALVCPYLIGVEAGDVAGTPLGQFQCTVADKSDTWLLIQSINRRLESPHDERLLRRAFDACWPSLQRRLGKVVVDLTTEQPAEEVNDDLSNESKLVLVKTSQDEHGNLMMLVDSGGFHLQAAGEALCEPENPRVEAAYRSAVNDLVSRGLLELEWARDGNEGFRITKAGYAAADKLQQR
jgi:hypothetical protein